MQRADSFEKTWCWESLRAGGEGDEIGWDGWMASPIQWTWVWVTSWSWWWTGRPSVPQFMGLQRVRHDWGTELNLLIEIKCVCMLSNSVEPDSSRPHGLKSTRLFCLWNFPERILEWVATSFFRRSSHPRDHTLVSSLIGRFFNTEP